MVHWAKVGSIKKLKVTLENMDEINLKIQDIYPVSNQFFRFIPPETPDSSGFLVFQVV